MGGIYLDSNQQNTSFKIGSKSFLCCTFWKNVCASWPDLAAKDDFAG